MEEYLKEIPIDELIEWLQNHRKDGFEKVDFESLGPSFVDTIGFRSWLNIYNHPEKTITMRFERLPQIVPEGWKSQSYCPTCNAKLEKENK